MKDNLDPIIDPSLRKMLDDLVNELNRTPEGEQKDEIRERIKKQPVLQAVFKNIHFFIFFLFDVSPYLDRQGL